MNSSKLGEELLNCIKSSKNNESRIYASKYFAGLTGSLEGLRFIDELQFPWVDIIIEYCDDSLIEVSLNCLISIVNLSAELDFHGNMITNEKLTIKLMSIISKNKLNDECIELTCKALSNLAQNESGAIKVCGFISDKLELFYSVIELFYNLSNNLHFFANFLSNITQAKRGRNFLVNHSKNIFSNLLVFITNRSNLTRQIGVVSTIRNCIFDIENHEWFLSSDVDVLPSLLLPLAGPEEFDDDDNEKLPPDLQYLEPTKKRDSSPIIRKLLIESISMLCCTKSGRSYIKSKNTYIIMRELHNWEKNEECIVALENLIQLLISDEPIDPNLADLHKVEIPRILKN